MPSPTALFPDGGRDGPENLPQATRLLAAKEKGLILPSPVESVRFAPLPRVVARRFLAPFKLLSLARDFLFPVEFYPLLLWPPSLYIPVVPGRNGLPGDSASSQDLTAPPLPTVFCSAL